MLFLKKLITFLIFVHSTITTNIKKKTKTEGVCLRKKAMVACTVALYNCK